MTRVPLDALTRAVVESGATGVTARAADALECRVAAREIPALADRLAQLGATCQFLAAADTRVSSGDFTLVYAFAPVTLTPRDVLIARTVCTLAALVEEKVLLEFERVAVGDGNNNR